MKLIVSTADLRALLSRLQTVVAQKATVPILSNFLIEATGDELIITATDLTVGMRCYIPAKVLEEGATTLPARRLTQLVRELTTAHLEITTGDDEITQVKANTSHFKVHGMSKKEFPSLPDISRAKKFTVSQSALKEAFYRTSFAVSREDNRYVLTGVYTQITEGKVIFVGTDGKRLAKTCMAISSDPELVGEYIIPLKAVEEIQKMLLEEGDVVFYVMADKIAVEANGSILISKLLTGSYPDINRVIPEGQDKEVELHREELVSLLRQMVLFTSDTEQSVRFTFGGGELRLNADSIDVGEGQVSMPINYTGESLDIAFNPKFFLDILRHSKRETVKMGLSDSFNPGVITESLALPKEEGSPSVEPLFVLMPMRLSVK